jgi:RNA 2',3'-cyclic 3'-phosphodiesterase
MLPNWFLALPVAPHVVLKLPRVPPGFRAFHPEDVHLTLSFLGACGEEAARRAFTTLEGRLRGERAAPLHVSLGKVVQMGPKARYSALSAVVDVGNDVAIAFLERFRNVGMDVVGLARDKRAPLPHVTVARPQRRATDEQRQLGLDWAQSVVLPQERLQLDHIALYTWSERRLPRLFQIVESAPLVGPTSALG